MKRCKLKSVDGECGRQGKWWKLELESGVAGAADGLDVVTVSPSFPNRSNMF